MFDDMEMIKDQVDALLEDAPAPKIGDIEIEELGQILRATTKRINLEIIRLVGTPHPLAIGPSYEATLLDYKNNIRRGMKMLLLYMNGVEAHLQHTFVTEEETSQDNNEAGFVCTRDDVGPDKAGADHDER